MASASWIFLMKGLQQTTSQKRVFLSGQRSGQSAFTLTELLVTIGIIGVLGSILLTTLGRAKLKGYTVYSQNNLHQLAAAYIGYEVEMGEFMPYDKVKDGSWVGEIKKREGYRKGVFFRQICHENGAFGPGDYRKAWRQL